MARVWAELSTEELLTLWQLEGLWNNTIFYKDNTWIIAAAPLWAVWTFLKSTWTTSIPAFDTPPSSTMTDWEIKIAYENNANTNDFNDAEKTKLAWLELAKNSFHYDNINKTVSLIGWITLNSNTTASYITTDWIYVYYSAANWYVNRINIDWTNNLVLNAVVSLYLATDWTYVYYRNHSTGFLNRINIDWTNNLVLNAADTSNIITDWVYIYYTTASQIWRIAINWTWAVKLNTDTSIYLATDWTYIYYRNHTASGYLYRMNINWTNQIALNAISSNNIITDWTYVYYRWASFYLTRINIDWTNETVLTAYSVNEITTDWIYIFLYTGTSSLIQMDIDWTNVKEINNVKSYGQTTDWVNVYYTNQSNWYLTKLNIANPQWYSYGDSLLESAAIENNSQKLAIKTYNNLPIDTSYTFELANLKQLTNILADWLSTDICCGDFNDYSGTATFLTDLTVWDTITLFKTWNADVEVIVSAIYTDTYLYFTPDVLCCQAGYWIKKEAANFTNIPVTDLNWTTEIDLDTVFWTTTTELYYKINLASTDNVKRPTINTIEILK